MQKFIKERKLLKKWVKPESCVKCERKLEKYEKWSKIRQLHKQKTPEYQVWEDFQFFF